MKTLKDIGEFGLIEKIRRWGRSVHPEVVLGIGDDVAVIDQGKKALLLTTDILIEEIHFKRVWIDPYRLGKKSLAVNLSDIASMGGTPKYFLVTLGLPKDLPVAFVSSLYRGFKEMIKRFQVELVGGDTSLSDRIVINICLIGEGKKDHLLFRSGAKIGEDLYVSGTLGDSALGLKILQDQNRIRKPKGLLERHLCPTPRVELGRALAKMKIASAMIDVSDGLVSDAGHILEESNVGARIWTDRLPLSPLLRKWARRYSEDPCHLGLNGGEDYELLFTSPRRWRPALARLSKTLNLPITRIGEILPKQAGLELIDPSGKEVSLPRPGFDHFK
ncbi:MAG: thiamine-phosphate kinase [Desulfobacterota bacterium]|nr:thiamine-phosphate kinase [Thermodesulfobacteriota bacterium]